MRGLLAAVAALVMLVVLAPSPARADGATFGSVAQAQLGADGEVRTPDQRALLRWDAATKTETLVIETTVTGPGTDFAWILPLPAVPKIEASTPGVFPTLRALSPLDVWVDVRPWWLAIFVAGGFIRYRRRLRETWPSLAAAGAVLGTVCVLVALSPGMDFHLGKNMTYGGQVKAAGAETHSVRVLSRETVGVWDTTVLTATEPADLRRWLTENGYVAPERIDPVVGAYLREGWVFVASKVRAAEASDGTRNIHPLAFTFPTEAAVYPMRLTGAMNDTLDAEIYVFGDQRAAAPGFETTHCTQFERYDEGPPVASWCGHTEIRHRVGDAKGCTRLRGTLEADDMTRDVMFSWDDLRDERPFYFTSAAAASAAAVPVALLLVIGWFLIDRRADRAGARQLWSRVALVGVAAVVGGGVWLGLPKVDKEVFAARDVALLTYLEFRSLDISAPPPPSFYGDVRTGPVFHDTATARAWLREVAARYADPATGERPREEDSPGNYLVEDRDGVIVLVQQSEWGPSDNPTDLSAFTRECGPENCVTLEGTVRDARGAPVPGAEVTVRRVAIRNTSWRSDPDARRATSDASGGFRVTVPRGFLCDVLVDSPAHVPATHRDVDLRTATPERLDALLEDAVPLRGRVVDASGRAVADAEIHLPDRLYSSRTRKLPVASDGTFEIPGCAPDAAPVEVTVHVHRDGLRCPSATFMLTPDAPPTDLAVELLPVPPEKKTKRSR